MNINWVDWGTLPEWLAGIGTVGSLIYAFRLFKREAQARRQQDEDRLRDLAKYVAVWINEGRTLTLRNGSEEPAYGVWIYHSREEVLDEEGRLLVLCNIELLPPLKEIDTGASVPRDMGTQMFRLVFTDARGIRWVRESGGSLIRVDSSMDLGKVGAMEAIRKASGGRWYAPRYG